MNKKIECYNPVIYMLRSMVGLIFIVFVSLVALVGFSYYLSETPDKTIYYFFNGPFLSLYDFGNMINMAVPLIIGGLGISLAFRSGSMNIGGEGQLYFGALIATLTVIALEPLGRAGAVIAIFVAMMSSGILAGISGVLRYRWNTNVLITSFLISNAVVLIVNYLITGPFDDPLTNLFSTQPIPETAELSYILPPSNLNTSLIVAVAAVFIIHALMYRSRTGFELRMYGDNPRFAKYAGVNVMYYQIMPMFVSGAMYALAGSLSIFGTYHATIKDFSSGMGWNALAVALIARYRPFAVIPAALFFAYIESGARSAMLYSDVTFELSSIVQATVFFLVSSVTLQRLGLKKRRI
ncbi:MAG: ABC transporter permease [Sphaerochaetaceae bacterium]|nr:ABC transporter permease [Sphaerochaetaceae bacterium]